MTSEMTIAGHGTEHPSLDVLSDFVLAATSAAHADSTVSRHVAACADCQASLTFLATLNARVEGLPAPVATAALLERIRASTATPLAMVDNARSAASLPPTRRRRWIPLLAAAAAVLVTILLSSLRRTPEAIAGPSAGTLTLSTSLPLRGDTVAVRYIPSTTLSRFRTLRLRARIRTREAEEYTATTPVIELAPLERAADGSFLGSFILPDSIVYAALAVEDSAATDIDDRDGRTWEVMRGATRAHATLSALNQRAGDHLGRSWEVIFETASQMVAAYPDSLTAWSYQLTAHSWMGLSSDSIRALHRERVRAFDRLMRSRPTPSADDMGMLYWYAHSVDTTVAAYWETRLRRAAPTNSFVVQNRLIELLTTLRSKPDTAAALREFEQLWRDAPPDRHEQVLQYATRIAADTRDTALLRRWTDRMLAQATGSSTRFPRGSVTRTVALDFARIPSLRAEGLRRLRDELARVRTTPPPFRALDETQQEYLARQQRGIRATLAALGRALSLDGQHRAALDTLQIAARDAWDLSVLRTLHTEALAAGDTAAALTASARLVTDPRTSAANRAEYTTLGKARMGDARWRALLDTAQQAFITNTLATMQPRTIVSAVPVRELAGGTRDLRASLGGGQITVVAFLSRFCGPAVEALPELRQLATELETAKIRTIAVFEEKVPSPELTAFLTKHRVTVPVFLDHDKSASATFNQWGTPYFYVVDARGRIMSEPTSDLDELRVNVEAIRLAGTMQ